MKMLKVTVSGDYRTATGEVVDYDNVVGIIPKCPEEWILSHVKNRFIGEWIKKDEKYKKRFHSARTVYIDKVETVEGEPSCIGKDIKELNWDELQELAVMKNLFTIPLKHTVDLRTARDTAYFEFNEKILGRKLKDRHGKMKDANGLFTVDYIFAELPAMIIDGISAADIPQKKSNSQVLDEAADRDIEEDGNDFTMEELVALAKQRGITHHPKIGYKKLYEKLFPNPASGGNDQ